MMVIMVSVKNMIKSIVKYFFNSDIVISFAINPLRWWRFQWDIETDTGMDPGLIINARIIIGPLGIVLFIDDGSW
jgi:hypothetical protein